MPDSKNDADGRKLFEKHHLLVEELIRTLSRRHCLGTDEREDFTSYAMLKLVENDYARFRKYQGRSSLKTYLTVVLQRLFLDYRTHKWGKWRPSSAALRLGSLAVKLEMLLYRDGHGFHEAREMLASTVDDVDGEELWELAIRLPRRERYQMLEEEALRKIPIPGLEIEEDRREKKRLVRSVESRLKEAAGELSDEERLILRMRFDEGMSVPDIADALELNPKALYARIGRLLKRLKDSLEFAGFGWKALEEISGWRELQVDFDRVFAMSNSGAPSV